MQNGERHDRIPATNMFKQYQEQSGVPQAHETFWQAGQTMGVGSGWVFWFTTCNILYHPFYHTGRPFAMFYFLSTRPRSLPASVSKFGVQLRQVRYAHIHVQRTAMFVLTSVLAANFWMESASRGRYKVGSRCTHRVHFWLFVRLSRPTWMSRSSAKQRWQGHQGAGEKHGQGQVEAFLRCSTATATTNCLSRKMG